MAISIPRWTGMLRRAGAPARAATEIATEVDQTVDGLVAQHEYDSAFERLLFTMQLGFQQVEAHFQQVDARFAQVDARMDAMEARLEASFNKRILTALGIGLTALAIATGILVALLIHYAG